MLAAPLDKRMEIRRQDNGTIIRCIGHTERIHEVSWSPDSRYVATAAGSSLTIWDPERGTPMAVLPLPGYPNLVGLHWAVALTATLHDGHVATWKLPADLWSPPGEDSGTARDLSNDERQRYGLPGQEGQRNTP
jgi:WD40 repeat protein